MATDTKIAFLQAVLGPNGYAALAKSGNLIPGIDTIVLPRCAIAWTKDLLTFEGFIPGTAIRAKLAKNDDGYYGEIEIKGRLYSFDKASEYFLAGCLVVALDADPPKDIKNVELARLGKSIDLLVKSHGGTAKSLRDLHKSALAKAERGQPATPNGPNIPPPDAPDPARIGKIKKPGQGATSQPQLPRNVSGTTQQPILKADLQNLSKPCHVCGLSQMRAGALTGCICFQELLKSTRYDITDHITLFLNEHWDTDSITQWIETVGVKDA